MTKGRIDFVARSATLDEIPVKVGGGKSWADEARILPGKWESVIDSQGVKDAEEARNRALGELQNASMEWQRAEVRCEGLCHAHPGMRATLKYVGERFSGEYVIERVNHEFDVNGFITELHLRRNMLPGEVKRTSAIDEERERQHNGGNNNASEASPQEEASMFNIGKNMDEESPDERNFVDSMNDDVSASSSETSSSQNTILIKSDERIEGYYYVIKNCLNYEKSETRYSNNRRMLINDLNMTLKTLSKLYN